MEGTSQRKGSENPMSNKIADVSVMIGVYAVSEILLLPGHAPRSHVFMI